MLILRGVLAASLFIALACANAVAGALPSYQKVPENLGGNIIAVGSDSMVNMMTLWAQAFNKYYPKVEFSIEGKGSATAPPSLIAGTAQLGPMSRQMKNSEIDAFESTYGYKPTAIGVALDALAIYVNKDNPIKGLTIQQIDAIFSQNRFQGYPYQIRTWGQVNVTGPWYGRPISLYGRNSASGTYAYFKKNILKNGDFRPDVKEQPGSAAVVQSISVDRYGIGYSSIGYRTASVKPIPIAAAPGEAFVEATIENVVNQTYPMGRLLYIYINKIPGRPLPKAQMEFIKFVLSKEGQQIVYKDGYVPISDEMAFEEMAKLLN